MTQQAGQGSGRTSPPERRRARRGPPSKSLRAELALDADILSLSPGGMLVRLPFPPGLGTRHDFTLVLGPEVLRLRGVVRHCTPLSEASSVGRGFHVGVEFVDLQDGEEASLDAFVSRRRT